MCHYCFALSCTYYQSAARVSWKLNSWKKLPFAFNIFKFTRQNASIFDGNSSWLSRSFSWNLPESVWFLRSPSLNWAHGKRGRISRISQWLSRLWMRRCAFSVYALKHWNGLLATVTTLRTRLVGAVGTPLVYIFSSNHFSIFNRWCYHAELILRPDCGP